MATLLVIPKTTTETLIFISRTPVKWIEIYPSNVIFYVCSEMKGFNKTLLSGQRKVQSSTKFAFIWESKEMLYRRIYNCWWKLLMEMGGKRVFKLLKFQVLCYFYNDKSTVIVNMNTKCLLIWKTTFSIFLSANSRLQQ